MATHTRMTIQMLINRPTRLLLVTLCLLGLGACSEETPAPVEAPVATMKPTKPTTTPVAVVDLQVLNVGGNGFRAEMGLADLRARYGAAWVVEQAVPLGEGSTEPGAIIYPDDPSRRAYVYFVEGKTTSLISAIHIRDQESIWTGPLGIKMGMSSTELDRLNGRPFKFLGFDWDYGGYVSNWADGTLAKAFLSPGSLAVRLAPPDLAEGSARPSGYPAGDSEFASDLPSVREQAPLVVEFGLAFVPKTD